MKLQRENGKDEGVRKHEPKGVRIRFAYEESSVA